MIWIWGVTPDKNALGLFALLGVLESVLVSVVLVASFVNWLERREKRGNGRA